MTKKFIALLLLFSLLLAVVPAEAAQPRYAYVHSISAGIDRSGSVLTCAGGGYTLHEDTDTYLTVTLLRCPQDGGIWSYVTSWSTSTHGYFLAYIEEDVNVDIGYDYQVYVVVRIKDANGTVLETASMCSDVNSYHTSQP